MNINDKLTRQETERQIDSDMREYEEFKTAKDNFTDSQYYDYHREETPQEKRRREII